MKSPSDHDLVAAYLRHEAAAGGVQSADAQACLRLAAEEWGVTVDRVRSAVLDHSSMLGAG